VKNKLKLGYEYLGEHSVKNIAEPARVYRVLMEPEAAGKVIGERRFLGRLSRRTALAAIIALVVVAGGLIGWNIYLQQSKKVEPASLDKMAYPLPDKPSIAVLPFDNMSAETEHEYFSDGLTEEIITALSKAPNIFVIARNSTFTYKGKPVKVQQVAEELGVRYVLEGSVRRTGDKVRITAQLVDAIKGLHLWAERYDRNLNDIFAIQDEITLKILTSLQVKLTRGEQARIEAKGTDNLEAYLKYIQALMYRLQFNKEGLVMSQKLLEEAITLDPNYANAYVGLGYTYWIDVLIGTSQSPEQSISKAMAMAKKALALDDSNPRAHGLLCYIYTIMRQHEKAIEEGERAIALAPNYADAYAYLSLPFLFVGKPQEVILLVEKAMRLNPIPPSFYYIHLGSAYSLIGRYEDSLNAFKKVVDQSPNNMIGHIGMAASYSLLGRDEEARAEAKEVLRINPRFSLERYASGLPYKNQADKDLHINALGKAGLE